MPFISFCIPTYQRQDHLLKLVRGILRSSSTEIEVVVQDNRSSDSTVKLLKEIDDLRLIILANEKNNGSLFNMVDVLHKGSGKYLFFITDKDYLFEGEIQNFIDFLRSNPNIIGGYCSHLEGGINTTYFKGIEAVANLGYLGNHPTGYFFRADVFKSLNFLQKYSNFDDVELFPFEFMMADMGVIGDLAIFRGPLCDNEKKEDAKKIKSYSINGNDEKAYFYPDSRLRMSVKFLHHVRSLDLTGYEKNKINFKIFISGLYLASFIFKKIMSDDAICSHHYISTRLVSNFDVIKIIGNFYIQFTKSIFKGNDLVLAIATFICLNLNLLRLIFKLVGRLISKKIRWL